MVAGIVNISDGKSIFPLADKDIDSFQRCEMLAQSPAAFKGSAYFLSNYLSDPVNGAEHLLYARNAVFND